MNDLLCLILNQDRCPGVDEINSEGKKITYRIEWVGAAEYCGHREAQGSFMCISI